MTLRTAILLGTSVLCTIIALPAHAVDRSPCQRLRGDDLAPARHVKLVVRPSSERRLANRRHAAKLVGCVLPRGPVRRIATREGVENDLAEDFDFKVRQVAGAIVLLSTTGSQIGYHSNEQTTAWDLRSGRSYPVARTCLDKNGSCTGEDEYRLGTAFVTRRGHAIAALERHLPTGSSPTIVVSSFAPGGTRTVLDAGPAADLPPASLALTGNIASWTHAGAPRRADVRGGPAG